MPDLSDDNRQRLFTLDAELRAEADRVLKESGIGRILQDAGFEPCGSYAMQTMTWRDLDFEHADDHPDWQQHWALGIKLAQTGWAWRFRCLDAYRDPHNAEDDGYYWGLQLTDTRGGKIWKLDIWTARAVEFERASPHRRLWTDLLTDDTRYRILAIKEKVCYLPEYRKSLISVHIYEAVLEHDIRNLDDFRDWWQKAYGKNTASGEFWYR